VSQQPVQHAWKVNECITAVNFYTASIQKTNQYRLHSSSRGTEGALLTWNPQ
jgi:hypothetical protein